MNELSDLKSKIQAPNFAPIPEKTADDWAKEYPPTKKEFHMRSRENPDDPNNWTWEEIERRRDAGLLSDDQRRFFGFPVVAKATSARPEPRPVASKADPLSALLQGLDEVVDTVPFHQFHFALIPNLADEILKSQAEAVPLCSEFEKLDRQDFERTEYFRDELEKLSLAERTKAVAEGRFSDIPIDEGRDQWKSRVDKERVVIREAMLGVSTKARSIVKRLLPMIQDGYRKLALARLDQEIVEAMVLQVEFRASEVLKRQAFYALNFTNKTTASYFANVAENPRRIFFGILNQAGPFTPKQ